MLPAASTGTREASAELTPDEDQGVIRCICDIDDDDGFTIQCENCLRAVEYQKRRLESEYKNSKDSRRRPRQVSAKARRAEDNSDRRKRAADAKHQRSKSSKPGGSRDSSSPTATRQLDTKGRDGQLTIDTSYTSIDRNILGADVQVLFQSVLSQLAEQRNAVSVAAANTSTTDPSVVVETAISQPAPESTAANPAAPVQAPSTQTLDTHKSTSIPSTAATDGKTNGSLLPTIVSMSQEELTNPIPIYRGVVGKDNGQVGVFARESIAQNRYICEYRGQVVLKAAYKEDPKNYYELLRTTRPHTHFHPEIDLCVDARRQGSEARFVRRSCSSNVALKSIHVPQSSDSLIHLGLFATRDITPDEELTIHWEWEDGELPAVSRMSQADADDYLGRPEGRRMSKVWRQAFGGMSCACSDDKCKVRQLFAMLGVEESAVRPDIGSGGGAIKRRVSRSARPENVNGIGDTTDQSPSSPRVQSPDGSRSVRGSHSRKASLVSIADAAPDSPSDRTSNSRDGLSVVTGRRVSY
ncbi:SET domain-containing protein 3, partial [Coemansia sp. RSA 2603]